MPKYKIWYESAYFTTFKIIITWAKAGRKYHNVNDEQKSSLGTIVAAEKFSIPELLYYFTAISVF